MVAEKLGQWWRSITDTGGGEARTQRADYSGGEARRHRAAYDGGKAQTHKAACGGGEALSHTYAMAPAHLASHRTLNLEYKDLRARHSIKQITCSGILDAGAS